MKLALAGGLLAASFALMLTLYVGARRRGLEAHCRNNLRHLGGLAARNWPSLDPNRTGRDFWQAVREAQYKDLRGKWQPMDPDPCVCPVLGTTVSKPEDARAIDYRGPAKVREQLKETPKAEPLGADRVGNHPSGGHVLRLDTSVEELPWLVERSQDGDAAWAAAAAALKD